MIGTAVPIMKIATGAITEELTEDEKNKAALNRAAKGGLARVQSLMKKRLREIARLGASALHSRKP